MRPRSDSRREKELRKEEIRRRRRRRRRKRVGEKEGDKKNSGAKWWETKRTATYVVGRYSQFRGSIHEQAGDTNLGLELRVTFSPGENACARSGENDPRLWLSATGRLLLLLLLARYSPLSPLSRGNADRTELSSNTRMTANTTQFTYKYTPADPVELGKRVPTCGA